jgi:NTE family protein
MFVFNATNMHTGVNFRFSKEYAGDYRLGLIPKPDHRVSYAVTASSAFPPFLSPVILKTEPGMFQFFKGADLWGNPDYSTQIYLTDGGVYDNMGLEPIWKRYRTVLVSDAGAPLLDQPQQCRFWHKQALRSLDISTQQSRALRKRILIYDYIQGKDTDAVPRNGTYWSIRSDITHFKLPDALPCDVNKTNALSVMRTRLNAFNDREQCELINWGYAVCDAAMRKHVLLNPPEIKPRLPYDKYPLST